MPRSTFRISSLFIFSTCVVVGVGGFVWWNRPPAPEYWQSGVQGGNTIQSAQIMRYLDDGWTEWEPLSPANAKSLVLIAEKCSIYRARLNGPGPSFPPPSTAVKIITLEKTVEIEILGSGFLMCTFDHATLITDEYREKLIELVDENSELYDRR